MDADKLKGMAIISVAEGARLGRVDEVLFDKAA
ncbi:MAG TPA: PRC-barrel domain-containing protein [Thermomicrobiales bacterium]|nr:PRC-barrel domain-containing protein [Thermomicrobiales bacterium]